MFNNFLVRAKSIHGSNYDYSSVVYVTSKQKIAIVCHRHGSFSQTPNNHLKGAGCPACGRERANLKTSDDRSTFIEKANKVHGTKYDYSPVVYTGSKNKVAILCLDHGIFRQAPNSHLKGVGCPRCGRDKANKSLRHSKEFFMSKAMKVHGTKYDYSLIDYKGDMLKIQVRCPKHGCFAQRPCSHLNGSGCPMCAKEKKAWNASDTCEFVTKAHGVHGSKYDYSHVSYVDSATFVTIVCPTHGPFSQIANNHLRGTGCPHCAIEIKAAKFRLSTVQFIEKSKKVHGNKYDYSKVVYTKAYDTIEIKCPKHGWFQQLAGVHMYGAGCPSCMESRGERKIAKFLGWNHIAYDREKRFEQCRDKRGLFFDFYVPSANTCIEYDGQQHFKPCKYFGGDKAFERTKRSDSIKNRFCEDTGISLVRISYDKTDDEMTTILSKEVLDRIAN